MMAADPSGMRAPARWIALLRIVVGAWFAKGVITKLTIVFAWGFLPVPAASDRWVAAMPKLLAKYAADNPFPAYRAYLLDRVIPDPAFYANLTAFGEAFVGLSLLAGLLTPLGAVTGLALTLLYGLAVQHMSSGQLGFHVILATSMVAFYFSRAGREWGCDAWLRVRFPAAAVIRWFT
jgi:uncharacterized membrane protein YphA (DoxX/SURF4 family)